MDSMPIILDTAHKHGVEEDDMLHAIRFPIRQFVQPDGMVMMIGAARDGVPIEVGLIEWYGDIVIAHAMRPARSKYLR